VAAAMLGKPLRMRAMAAAMRIPCQVAAMRDWAAVAEMWVRMGRRGCMVSGPPGCG
jgi:hypothetical protein